MPVSVKYDDAVVDAGEYGQYRAVGFGQPRQQPVSLGRVIDSGSLFPVVGIVDTQVRLRAGTDGGDSTVLLVPAR